MRSLYMYIKNVQMYNFIWRCSWLTSNKKSGLNWFAHSKTWKVIFIVISIFPDFLFTNMWSPKRQCIRLYYCLLLILDAHGNGSPQVFIAWYLYHGPWLAYIVHKLNLQIRWKVLMPLMFGTVEALVQKGSHTIVMMVHVSHPSSCWYTCKYAFTNFPLKWNDGGGVEYM